MLMASRKVDRKAKPGGKKSWAEELRAEGVGLDRDQGQCELPPDFRRDEIELGGVADRVPVPLESKPKRKAKCVRR
jgi:hypothetical protein